MANAKPDSWLEVRTPHFVILSNSGEKQAQHVADQFERMRSVFHKNFPAAKVDAASPIIVIAVKDKKAFATLEPEEYLAKGQLNLAGLFLRTPDKNYILLRMDAEGEHPFATVYHEYTHFMLAREQEWLPLWLNEGLAEFYQNTDIKEKEVALGEASPENLMVLQQNRLLPLTTLFAVDYKSPYYHEENKGSIFYAESWALTHYLQIKDRQDKTSRLSDYGKLVSNNVDATTAATQAFGDLNQLQKKLEKYVEQGSFFYFRVAGATEVDEAAFKDRALSVAQADAVRADFLACNGRTKDARGLLDRVLQDEPNNVAAHETMGYLGFREGNLEEAEKWYVQAAKLDPQNYLAQYYSAVIAMHEGLTNEKADQIEENLRVATTLNPLFAPAFDQLAVFYGRQRKNLDEAYKLSVAAIKLEPDDVTFRMDWAHVLMQMDRSKSAVAVLQAALKLSRNPEQTAAIQGEIESIERYQALRERHEKEYAEDRQRSAVVDQVVVHEDSTTEKAEEQKQGPRRTVRGTLGEVQCSSASTMRLKLAGVGKPLRLHSRNYFKVEYSALNFTPSSDLNPCKDLEGMKAKVEYFEAPNDSSEGQIISIELTK